MPTNRVTVTNAVQLQQALNDAATQPISVIRIDQDIINITTPLVLPSTLFTPGKHLIIQGNGTTIQPSVPGPGGPTHLMIMDNPNAPNTLDWTAANTMLLNTFTFDDITFKGRNSSSLVALVEFFASRQSTFKNCKFLDGPNGLKLGFAPETRIINCYARYITGVSFDINEATMVNVPVNSETGSSFSRIENCVIDNIGGNFAGISVIGSGNCVISQVIFQDKGPRYHIYYDSNSQFNANSIFIDNVIFRIAPIAPQSGYNAAIKLKMYGGYAKISGIVTYLYAGTQPLISAENQLTNPQTTLPRVFVEHYPIIYPNIKFETGNACSDDNIIWSFFDVDDGRNIFTPGRWIANVVPKHRKSEYFDNDNEIVTNSMKVNNNIISA